MSRLASLSTPDRRSSPSPSSSPAVHPSASTPTRMIETTHHRMLKLIIVEIRGVMRTWDELAMVDGMKAGKGVIDAATTMDNLLQTAEEERPAFVPYYLTYRTQTAAMETVLAKLNKLVAKLHALVDQADKLYFDACRLQGYAWVTDEPLWLSWTMQHFIDSLAPLLTLHNAHLHTLASISQTILDPESGFDAAKLALERWRDLGEAGDRWEGVREWEELVELEMTTQRVDGEDEDEEERLGLTSGAGVGSGRKKKGKR